MSKAALPPGIRRIAVAVKWAAIAGMIGIVAAAIYSLAHQTNTWEIGSMSVVGAHSHASPGAIADPGLSLWLELLPAATLFYGLFRLVQMMGACEHGEIFSYRVAQHLQAFSMTIFLVELLSITLPLQIAALTTLLGRGNSLTTLTATATGSELWSLLLAALFLMLAQILKEAARVAEDNASIV
jgi:hypothetical protein